MRALLEMLRTDGHLSALDQHFASAICRLAGEPRSEVELATAILSQQLSRGHVCLDLAEISEHSEFFGGKLGQLPNRDGWIALLRASPLVSDGNRDGKTPLVLNERGWLYLHRYWEHEEVLAEHILARADVAPIQVDSPVLEEGLSRLFPPDGSEEFDYQRMAAFMAVRKSFCVVSGGPGTGKTHTVVKILALLIEQALAAGAPPPHITLVAPTGKAAARLLESIKNSKTALDCAEEVRAAIVETASTIHRCLGTIGGSSTRFRHHRDNPLVTDLVLVDEASMVNLGLMRRLTSAMPSHARLILLGDMDQLASVEAGSVLGDICNSGSKHLYSATLRDEIEASGGGKLPNSQVADSPPALSDCVAKLVKSYRFSGDTGIARLARAINQGDHEAATEALSRFDDVSLVPPAPAGTLSNTLKRSVREGYKSYLEPGEVRDRLTRFDQFRILCARQSGAFGVKVFNELVVSQLRRQGMIESGIENYEGRPIMITANNYDLQLYNGDIGVVLPDSKSGELRACFAAADGGVRMFAPSRLPSQESALAMSVHKSQGSEFDEVAIVLPDEISPLLSRELIYTAVTRARKRVVIHGHLAALRYAIEHPTLRRSGLRPALWSQR